MQAEVDIQAAREVVADTGAVAGRCNDMAMYYVVLAICIGGFALIVRLVHWPFGQVLKATWAPS